MLEIEVKVDSYPEIKVKHDSDPEIRVNADSYMQVITGDAYTGEYSVNPDFEGKVLKTKNLQMTDNVTVNPIQVESVSNLSGGRTVYIGGII